MSSRGSRNSVEQTAGLLLAVHWAIWITTVVRMLQMDLHLFHVFFLNLVSIGIVASSIGYFARSGYLFAVSIPLQMAAVYGFLCNYCLISVYDFVGNWPEFVISFYHLSVVSSLFLYDIYISIGCTRSLLQKQKTPKEFHLRSPNASFITAFAQRLGSPPIHEETETPRCRSASANSIEDVFADYEAVDAVTLA